MQSSIKPKTKRSRIKRREGKILPTIKVSHIFTKQLTFVDDDLETSFLDSRAVQQLKLFRFLCLTLAAISSPNFLANPTQETDFQISLYLIPYITTISLLATAYLLVVYKFPKKAETGLIFTALCYGILVGKAFRQLIPNVEDGIKHRWITDIILLIICVFIIGSRMRWIYCGGTLLFLYFYISIRVWNDLVNTTRILSSILGIITYSVLIPFLAYLKEQDERQFFYSVNEKTENLKAFHLLIKDVLPSSIILLDGERIQFFNNRIKEMFGVKNENDLINIMRLIEVNDSFFFEYLFFNREKKTSFLKVKIK